MIVRLRFGRGSKVARKERKNQRVALAAAALLTPATFLALVLGLWRIASDLELADEFAFAGGPLSHWQMWVGCAVVLQGCTWLLNRYGRVR
jgi:hypothetical protein